MSTSDDAVGLQFIEPDPEELAEWDRDRLEATCDAFLEAAKGIGLSPVLAMLGNDEGTVHRLATDSPIRLTRAMAKIIVVLLDKLPVTIDSRERLIKLASQLHAGLRGLSADDFRAEAEHIRWMWQNDEDEEGDSDGP